jgi:hypothetical protein
VSSGARARAGARIPAGIVTRGGNGSSATTPRSVGSAAKLLERAQSRAGVRRGCEAERRAQVAKVRPAGRGVSGTEGSVRRKRKGLTVGVERPARGKGRARLREDWAWARPTRGKREKGEEGCAGPREGKERGKGVQGRKESGPG